MNGPLAWCAAENTFEEYLQIHVPEAETICAIALQGNGYLLSGNDYVSAYYVEYSNDGIEWKIVKEDGKTKV